MPDNRAADVIERLEACLVDFIRRERVTQEEYRAAVDLVISSIRAGEESLLFDVFLEAAATDVGDADRQGSTAAIEGPFHLEGAPLLMEPYELPRRPDERGEPLLFEGSVRRTDGSPVAGAELDIWHADADGLYSNIFPGIPLWNLRGRLRTGADGTFAVRTIKPPPYEIPKEGPTGTVLGILGRHCFRPAHVHVKVAAPGLEALTSQLYFTGGAYLDSDVAGAVRDGLLITATPDAQGTLVCHYDFALEATGAPA